MPLDSYDCELCLLIKEEKLRHLFFKCPFARNCWNQISINPPMWLKPDRASRNIKRALRVPFAVDIIILMCWSIWHERNAWIFNFEYPQVAKCLATFRREFALVIHRANPTWSVGMESWISDVYALVIYFLCFGFLFFCYSCCFLSLNLVSF
jgi:hypothetical protein